jgi:hypothetical protein
LFLTPPFVNSLKDYLSLAGAVRTGNVDLYVRLTDYNNTGGSLVDMYFYWFPCLLGSLSPLPTSTSPTPFKQSFSETLERFKKDGVDLLVKRLIYWTK